MVRSRAISMALLFIVPAILMMVPMQEVSAGTAVITVFDDGTSSKELDFEAQKSYTSLGFKIPKQSVVSSASMDLQADKVEHPGQIYLDTRDDFLASEPINLDLNKTYGNAYLIGGENGTDEFNDGSLDLGNWTWTNPPFAVNENQGTGMVEIQSEANTNWWNNTQTGHFLHRPITGDFLVTVKMSSNPDENFEKAGMMVFSDSNNFFEFIYRYRRIDDHGGKCLSTAIRSGGGGMNDHRTNMNSNPFYMRITRYGNQWTTLGSPDAVVWTQHRQWNQNLPNTIEVGLLVTDGMSNTNFRADFDYFRVSQYIEDGYMHYGPVTTPLPVERVYLDQDLKQLEIWEKFSVEVRSNATGPWEKVIGGADHTISVPGTELELRINISGMGWTTPTVRSVTLDYYPESHPSDVTIDVGNDGSIEWQLNGTFTITTTVNNDEFIQALEDQKNSLTADGDGYVHIPMKVVSQTPGLIDFTNLEINLFTGTPPTAPELGGPDDGIWVGTLIPSFNFSSYDPDADTLFYKVELSEDGFTTLSHSFDQQGDTYGWSENLYYSEQEARFTMYSEKPLQHAKTYKWRVKAFDGGWWSDYSEVRTLSVDVSLPTGKITDGGTATPVTREIEATVKFTDAESGIGSIECGLGTGANKTDVVDLTDIDVATGKIHYTNLSLQNGKTYYFTCRARNSAGTMSMFVTSDGIKIDLDLDAPPSVVVQNPSNRSVVDGTLTISGTAFDPDPGDTIEVFVAIDNGLFEKALGSTIWSFDWDTTTVSDGEHSIFVKASDSMRDSPTVLVLVIVGNGRLGFRFISWIPENDPTINEKESIEMSAVLRDPGGIFVSYTWTIDGISVPFINAKNYTYATDYDDAGVHVVEITAMGVGTTTTHKWNVTVLNVNRAPKAMILAPKDKVAVGLEEKLDFDGTGSSDPDGETLKYSWDFGDGSSAATGSRVTHKYKKEGTFKVTLTVTDPYNQTSLSEINVKVAEETDIITTFTTMPMCLLPIVILVVIIVVVILVALKSKKRTQKFEANLVDDDQSIPQYDPTPQMEGYEAPTDGTPETPPEQEPVPPAGPATPPPAVTPPPPSTQQAAQGPAPVEQPPAAPAPEPEPEPVPEPAPAPAPAPEPVPDTAPEDYQVVDTEASKQGPAWGTGSPFSDEQPGGEKASGPAWAKKEEDEDTE